MLQKVFDRRLSSQEKLSDQEAKGGVSYCGPGDVLVCGAECSVGVFNHTKPASRPNI